MQYNFRGTYNSSLNYNKLDVVIYKKSDGDPKKIFMCITNILSTSPQEPNPLNDTTYWVILNSNSNFPETIDSFVSHTNIGASDVPKISRFQELTLKTNKTLTEQDELDSLSNELREKIISPEDFNKLQAALQNMQMFISAEVIGFINQKQGEMQTYIDGKKNEINIYTDSKKTEMEASKNAMLSEVSKFTYKGEYNSFAQYFKWNVVTYNGDSYLALVDTVNFAPTDASKWAKVAQKGLQGDRGLPGMGLVFKGTYDPAFTYVPNQAVEYQGSVYFCTQQALGETPQDNGVSWDLFLSRSLIQVTPTTPSNPTDKQVWVDTQTQKFKVYNQVTSAWDDLNAKNADTLGGQLPSYYATDQELGDVDNKIGVLNSLTTTAKTNVVSSINELKAKTDDIGTKSQLQTTVKTDLVSAVNENINTMNQIKKDLEILYWMGV
jgi:hypothetical protein